MTRVPDEPSAFPVPPEVYEQLAAATPAERAEIVLDLIASHPEGRLELPAVDGKGAMLDEVDLGRAALEGRLGLESETGAGPPAWWDAEWRGVRLAGADLRGASLRKANLRGAVLADGDLQGALLGGADLGEARLDRARLAQADLAGAVLEAAQLGEADVRGAMLEEANLRSALLRFVKCGDAVLEEADLRDADLWGADLRGALATNADFRGAVLEEAVGGNADFSGSRFERAVLKRADFRAARFVAADLRGVSLVGTNLGDAVLKDARLQDAELSQTVLTHVCLNGARLEGARFQQSQLGGAIGEELAGEFEDARRGYLVLERAFEDLGDPDAANWAYRRRRRMQKYETRRQARASHAAGHWGEAVAGYSRYAGDQFVEWLCDYGESIRRVILSLFVLYLVFTVLYGVTGSVVREEEGPGGTTKYTTRHPLDLAIFSLLAMTTGSIGIRLLPGHDLALVLVGIQVFLGVALIGLFGFVLGNRIRR